MFSKKLFLLQELILCYGFCEAFVPTTLCCPSTETQQQAVSSQEVQRRKDAAEKYANKRVTSCEELRMNEKKQRLLRGVHTAADIQKQHEKEMYPWREGFELQEPKMAGGTMQTLPGLEKKKEKDWLLTRALSYVQGQVGLLDKHFEPAWLDQIKELDKLEEKIIEYTRALLFNHHDYITSLKQEEENLGKPLNLPSTYGPLAIRFPELYDEFIVQIKIHNDSWQVYLQKLRERTPMLFKQEWEQLAWIVFVATYVEHYILHEVECVEEWKEEIANQLQKLELEENEQKEVTRQQNIGLKKILDKSNSKKRLLIEKTKQVIAQLLQHIRSLLSEQSSVLQELGFTEDELMESFYAQINTKPELSLRNGLIGKHLQASEEKRFITLRCEVSRKIGMGFFLHAIAKHEREQVALFKDYEEKVQQALHALPAHERGELVPLPPVDDWEEVQLKESGGLSIVELSKLSTVSPTWEERQEDFGGLSVAELSKLSEAELAEHFRILEEKKAEKKLEAQQVAVNTELQVVRVSPKLRSVGTVLEPQNVKPVSVNLVIESQLAGVTAITGEQPDRIRSAPQQGIFTPEPQDVDLVAESQPTGIVQTLQDNPLPVVATIGAMVASAWVGLSKYGNKACSTVTSLFTKSSAKTPHSKVVHRRVLD